MTYESTGHFWVALPAIVNDDQVKSCLAAMFPALTVERSADDYFNYNDFDLLFRVDFYEGKEFQSFVNFYKIPGSPGTEVEIGIGVAHFFSQWFDMRTICDGSGYGDDDSPYWCIVWENDVAYLVDDCGDTQFDGGNDPVKVIRSLDLSRSLPTLESLRR